MRLEPQVTDNQIVLRLVRPTESVILRMCFGIRLSRRLLRRADLAIRGGQVALGLRDILPGLRQVGLRLGERLGRRVKIRLVGLDVLLRLRQLRRIILQHRLIVSQILLNLLDLIRRHGGRHGHSGNRRPVGAVARMVHGTQSIGVLRTCGQTGDDVIALPRLGGADDLHSSRIDALAHLDMVEVRLHLRAGSGLAVPMDGDHA